MANGFLCARGRTLRFTVGAALLTTPVALSCAKPYGPNTGPQEPIVNEGPQPETPPDGPADVPADAPAEPPTGEQPDPTDPPPRDKPTITTVNPGPQTPPKPAPKVMVNPGPTAPPTGAKPRI